jgi:glycerol-3-phosphate O-acyltransferase
VRIQKLAFEVCNRIEHATPINGTDLVTLVLLGADGRALTEGEIRAQATEVLGLIESGKLPRTSGLARETGEELHATLGTLARTGLLEAYEDGTEPVWRISPGKELAAAYYRNTIVHYFLASAVAELALAATIAQPAEDRAAAVRAGIVGIRDLLKFEFFFPGKAAFVADGVAYLDSRYPGWRTSRAPYAATPPLFGHSVLRSFVEAYHVLANVLVAGDAIDDDARLSDACMKTGGQMLRRRQIGSESALSGPLFANALRLARHRGLIGGTDGDAAVARQAFLARTRQLSAALALVQRHYDQAIERTIAGGSRT